MPHLRIETFGRQPLLADRSTLLRFAAVTLMVGAAIVNEWTVARYISMDGTLESSTTISVRLLQAILLTTGIAVLLKRWIVLPSLAVVLVGINLFSFRQDVLNDPGDPRWRDTAPLRSLHDWLGNEKRVSYVGDEAPFASPHSTYYPFTTSRALERYYLMQTFATPTLLGLGTPDDLVIADHRAPDSRVPAGTVTVHDFGAGVMLLRQK